MKMGGYICDYCRVILLYPEDPHYLQAKLLLENPNIILRIYCKECEKVIKKIALAIEEAEENNGKKNIFHSRPPLGTRQYN